LQSDFGAPAQGWKNGNVLQQLLNDGDPVSESESVGNLATKFLSTATTAVTGEAAGMDVSVLSSEDTTVGPDPLFEDVA